MEQFVIQSRTSLCRKREGGVEKALKQDIIAFYHGDYQGGGNWRVPSTIENLICTFKNDITTYPQQTLNNAINKLTINLWKKRIKRDKCLRNACQ